MQEQQSVAFEKRVSALYGVLGYHTEHDVLLGGNQVDILAKYAVPAGPPVRLVIEAKWVSDPKRSVSKDTVADYLPVARNLLSAGLCSSVVVVSNRAFTRFAKELVIGDPQIDLFTVDELEQRLILGSPQLARHSAAYWASPIGNLFVEPSARLVSDLDASVATEPFSGSELMDRASVAARSPVVLFADYGAGKSTLLDRLKHLALRQLIEAESSVLPLLFQLKEYGASTSLEEFIRSTCFRELGREFDVSVFWELMDQGKFLLFLDGFDEMAGAPTASERVDLLTLLSPLLFGRSKVVLSTRPAYFTSRRDLESAIKRAAEAGGLLAKSNRRRELLGSDGERILSHLRETSAPRGSSIQFAQPFELVELMPLGAESISEYLHRFDDEWCSKGFGDGETVKTFLDAIYDLSDLLTRPLLLSMIVEMLLSGFLDLNKPQSLGAAQLYEIYTEMKLISDFDKGGPRAAGERGTDRRAFAEECAVALLRHESLELEPSLALEIATGIGGHFKEQEQLLTDFRTCSFLTVTPGGYFKFVHKSFYEYFLACRLYDAIDVEDWDLLSESVPTESSMFVGSMLQLKPSRAEKVVALLRRMSDGNTPLSADQLIQALGNLASMALWGSVDIRGVSLKDVAIPRSKFANVELSDVRMANTVIEGHVGDVLEINRSTSISAVLRGVRIETLSLDAVKRARLELEESRIGDVQIARTNLDLSLLDVDIQCVNVADEGHLALAGTVVRDRRTPPSRSVVKVKSGGSIVEILNPIQIEELTAARSTIEYDGPSLKVVDISSCNFVVRASSFSGVCRGRGRVGQSLVVILGQDIQPLGGPAQVTFDRCLFILGSTVSLETLAALKLQNCAVLGGRLDLEARAVKGRPDERRNVVAYELQHLVGTVVADSSGGAGKTIPTVDVDAPSLRATVLNPRSDVAKRFTAQLESLSNEVKGIRPEHWPPLAAGFVESLRGSSQHEHVLPWLDSWLAEVDAGFESA